MDSWPLLRAMDKRGIGEGVLCCRMAGDRAQRRDRTGTSGAMDQRDGAAALNLHGLSRIMECGLRHFAGFAAAFLNDFIQP